LTYEGVFRQASVVKGRNRNTAWFAAIDAEWPALDQAFSVWLTPANFAPERHHKERLSISRGWYAWAVTRYFSGFKSPDAEQCAPELNRQAWPDKRLAVVAFLWAVSSFFVAL
jgi:hypothetical protein